MSGGAGVIAAMWAIGKLKPKLNVIGLVPSSENLPGPRAMKPGDILRAMNGKTIEVINTDAEGRLILADALCYARELGATKIIDAATLTGACVVALGHAASGDDVERRRLRRALPQGRRRRRRTLLAPAALSRLRPADQERHRRPQEHRRPPRAAPKPPARSSRTSSPTRRGSTSTSRAPPISTASRRTWRRARPARRCARSSRSSKTSRRTAHRRTASRRPPPQRVA